MGLQNVPDMHASSGVTLGMHLARAQTLANRVLQPFNGLQSFEGDFGMDWNNLVMS